MGRWKASWEAMAHPGDVLVHPTSGQRLIFRRTQAQTDGRLLECDVFYAPGEPRPTEHVHATQEHQIEVLTGALVAVLREQVHQLRAGDVLLIPTGDPHAVWNPSSQPAHAVWHTCPAGDIESYLETNWLAPLVSNRD